MPQDAQHDLSLEVVYEERSARQSQEAYDQAQVLLATPGKKGDAEKILKDLGLRNVSVSFAVPCNRSGSWNNIFCNLTIQNAFWALKDTCPHQALCFDVLHAFDGGLWGKHLWVEFISIIKNAGHMDKLNARYNEMVQI